MQTHKQIHIIFVVLSLFAASSASALDLSSSSNNDRVVSLKQALTQGAEAAVKSLAKKNSFFGSNLTPRT